MLLILKNLNYLFQYNNILLKKHLLEYINHLHQKKGYNEFYFPFELVTPNVLEYNVPFVSLF